MDLYVDIFKNGAVTGMIAGLVIFLTVYGLTIGARLFKHIK